MYYFFLALNPSQIIAIAIVLLIGGILLGYISGYFYRKKLAESKIGSAETEATRIIERSLKDVEARKKEILLEAKEESIRLKSEYEKENKDRRNELSRLERRIVNKEETVDKKLEVLEKKEEEIQRKSERLDKHNEILKGKIREQQVILEKISGMTTEEAKQSLLSNIESEINIEAGIIIKEMEQEIKSTADKKALEIVSLAMQRCDVNHVVESTVSVVNLPSDEMKGRIIGREGRNIRTLESLTGIDLIIDDTPEAVVISGFSALRREVARIALEKLILDGRIHPTRIEEMVEKAKKEVDVIIKEEGEAATFEVGVFNLHPELIKLLGKLKYRTSYGQNVLKHSIEVAQLCGIMASMMNCDVNMAKRAGLLHDIGKAVDKENEGTHVSLGVDLCKRYKENQIVINAVESHHGDVDPTSTIAIIVQVADSISGARPGARRETLETYINRLEKLEEIADSHVGVEKSFAIQAGRELRVILIPEQIDDSGMPYLARQIAKKIENELQYPGQIKISTIRETRAVEYAK